MSAQHTPGPWRIAALPEVGQVDVETSVGNVGGGELIARCGYPFPFATDNAERNANARLIAAAPELLALCVRFESWLTDTEAGERARGERSFDSQGLLDLRAAIAKAEAA